MDRILRLDKIIGGKTFKPDMRKKPNGKAEPNQVTLACQIVVDICIALQEFGPYVHAASPKTCSFYIKFKEWGLGGLRISNHKSRYLYKWNISVCDYFKDTVTHKNNSTQYYCNYKNIEPFIKFMRKTFNDT